VIVRKLRARNSRQISFSKPTKERTIQHLLNVFVLKNVLNFAKPAKPESGCQITMLGGLTRCDPATTKPIGWIDESSAQTSEVSARENFCPLRLLCRAGLSEYPILKWRQRSF
jgi:hypothetical protein